MEIQVNGESREVPDNTTLTTLLHALNIGMARVAVEVNLEVLEPQEFDKRELRHGDRVEILSFIGGGREGDGLGRGATSWSTKESNRPRTERRLGQGVGE